MPFGRAPVTVIIALALAYQIVRNIIRDAAGEHILKACPRLVLQARPDFSVSAGSPMPGDAAHEIPLRREESSLDANKGCISEELARKLSQSTSQRPVGTASIKITIETF